MSRKSAVLACQRIEGRHDHSALALALHNVHTQFGITYKITMTTTDNASNMVAAFKAYSPELDPPPPQEESDEEMLSESDDEADNAVIEVGSEPAAAVDGSDADPFRLETVDVYNLFCECVYPCAEPMADSDSPDVIESSAFPSPVVSKAPLIPGEPAVVVVDTVEVQLPRHQRCAAHTFNLMGTTDTARVLYSKEPQPAKRLLPAYCVTSTYRESYLDAVAILRSFWAKYNRSSQVNK